jgi:hypothetical protein
MLNHHAILEKYAFGAMIQPAYGAAGLHANAMKRAAVTPETVRPERNHDPDNFAI